jgi:hypothetical protein
MTETQPEPMTVPDPDVSDVPGVPEAPDTSPPEENGEDEGESDTGSRYDGGEIPR